MTEKSSVSIFDENYKIISENIKRAALKSGRHEDSVILLAATKTVDVAVINHAIKSGINYIGENRVQEFLSKENDLADVHRHFIGHLQTNKVKDIVEKVELIHSVDSVKLAKEISKKCEALGIKRDILLEVNIGNESSKSGFKKEELDERLYEIAELKGIFVKGLMAIPPICNQPQENRRYFTEMQKLFVDNSLKKIDNISMDILSMGMSDDYEVAIECGATLVRLGTALFGKRNYNI